jgi:hypothetical protein
MRTTDYPPTLNNPGLTEEELGEDEDTKKIFDDTYCLETEKIYGENVDNYKISWHMHIQVFQNTSTGVYKIDYDIQNTTEDCHEHFTNVEISAQDHPAEVVLLEKIASCDASTSMSDLWILIDSFYRCLGNDGPEIWAMNVFKEICDFVEAILG